MSSRISLRLPGQGCRRFTIVNVLKESREDPLALVLVGDAFTIGREPCADIPIEGRLEEKHALIVDLNGSCRILPLWGCHRRDRDVFVGAIRCETTRELRDGDEIVFGASHSCCWSYHELGGAAIFSARSRSVIRANGFAFSHAILLRRSLSLGTGQGPLAAVDLPAPLTLTNQGRIVRVTSEGASISGRKVDRGGVRTVDVFIERDDLSFEEELALSAVEGRSPEGKLRLYSLR